MGRRGSSPGTLKYIPGKILFFDGEVLGILLFGLAGFLWLMVPFWDGKSSRGENNRLVTYAGIFVVFYIIVLTIVVWIV